MLEKAVRICEANFGNMYCWEGDVFRALRYTMRHPNLWISQEFANSTLIRMLSPSIESCAQSRSVQIGDGAGGRT